MLFYHLDNQVFVQKSELILQTGQTDNKDIINIDRESSSDEEGELKEISNKVEKNIMETSSIQSTIERVKRKLNDEPKPKTIKPLTTTPLLKKAKQDGAQKMTFRIVSKNTKSNNNSESYSPEKPSFQKDSIRRPYNCKYCNKSFVHRGTRHRHQKTHDEDIIYSCDICGKEMVRKDYLLSHYRTQHPDETMPDEFTIKDNVTDTYSTTPARKRTVPDKV